MHFLCKTKIPVIERKLNKRQVHLYHESGVRTIPCQIPNRMMCNPALVPCHCTSNNNFNKNLLEIINSTLHKVINKKMKDKLVESSNYTIHQLNYIHYSSFPHHFMASLMLPCAYDDPACASCRHI